MVATLPPPRANKPKNHVAMSLRFLDHAQIELDAGRRLQASEKVWGAVAHMLKAIGKQRGWRNRSHNSLHAINSQMAAEYGRPELLDLYHAPSYMHSNFYENVIEAKGIQRAINQTRQYVNELNALRKKPPRQFTVTTNDDQARIATLYGIRYNTQADLNAQVPKGITHTSGFSLKTGRIIPPDDSGNSPGNSGTPVKPVQPRGPNPGSQALRVPRPKPPKIEPPKAQATDLFGGFMCLQLPKALRSKIKPPKARGRG